MGFHYEKTKFWLFISRWRQQKASDRQLMSKNKKDSWVEHEKQFVMMCPIVHVFF